VGRVNWKVAIALGAAIGGVMYAVLRKNRSTAADAELWAEATDPIVRFGDS
jgi:predicted MFS family arabinose efflux permease